MQNDNLIIKGAKENNLKDVDLTIPKNKLVVFTGVSGSGKSTLAFDTIFAEGQRRYMESLSSYARMFLGGSSKPNVESIEGLSPAISIDQKSTNRNPRSTVGTITEIYDYMRLLFAKIGRPFCPNCNKEIKTQSIDQIVELIIKGYESERALINSPIIHGQKGQHQGLLESLKKDGFKRVIIDDIRYDLEEEIHLDKNIKHNITVVIDRIAVSREKQQRLTESIEQALTLSEGLVEIQTDDKKETFSTRYACDTCGFSIEEITPRLFSFNSPFGACENCSGLGYTMDIDESLVLKNGFLSIRGGAFSGCGWNYELGGMAKAYFDALAFKYDFDLNAPVNTLDKSKLNIILYGNNGEILDCKVSKSGAKTSIFSSDWEGVIPNLKRRYKETKSEFMRFEISKYMKEQRCPVCTGKRLKQEALMVKINNKDIMETCDMSVVNLLDYIKTLKLTSHEQHIAKSILKEIIARLNFLNNVGLSYLTLNRMAETLSGGESQRIRLATQIGSGLSGVLYILDEPSIGLHQSDNEKLLKTLQDLRDLGNSLIVVEHDEDTMRAADFIVDIGPFAGVHGGEVVAKGTVEDICACERSITGKFLCGKEQIEIPKERKKPKGYLEFHGCKQNNLKNVNVKIPVGCFTAVTGVSGSGKSSLITNTVYPYLANELNGARKDLGKCGKVKGVEYFDKVINIDQSPIGKTPRSNPATYVGVFTSIRELFAQTPSARERGYTYRRFSFNVPGGRCDRCEGDGVKTIEMYFLPDIEVPCEVCKGKRYNHETLEVRYKGKNIADVLDMTVDEALDFFINIPKIRDKLQALTDVGLGYLKLGQSSTTLSGGEAQRVKLASELCRKSTGQTIYILDEPTTGLSSYDVKKLVNILKRLVSMGNTVVVIEHNLDVIKVADYLIDLGPEGGDNGGEIVAFGTPEEVAFSPVSKTAKFIREILSKNKRWMKF